MPPAEPVEASGVFVQSLARGLSVIQAFDGEHQSMTLSAVAQRAGLSRATTRRLLLTLVELGYMRFDGTHFSLTPQVLRFCFSYLSGMSLPELAQPHLEAVSQRTGESTSVAVLDDGEVFYVARAAVRRIMTISISVGTHFPAFATSLGRVLLAGLPEAELESFLETVQIQPLTEYTVRDVSALRQAITQAKEQGWCVVDQELEIGLISMAAPLYDARGRTVAAINTSLQAQQVMQRGAEEYLAEIRAELLSTAARISEEIGVIR